MKTKVEGTQIRHCLTNKEIKKTWETYRIKTIRKGDPICVTGLSTKKIKVMEQDDYLN